MSGPDLKDIVNVVVGGTAQSPLFATEPAEFSIPEQATMYATLCHLEALIAERKKALRAGLLAQTETSGEPFGDKGSKKLVFDDAITTLERKTAKEPDHEEFVSYVKEAGLSVTDAFDEVKVFEYNPSKVQYLVEIGKLDKSKIESLCRVTLSLSVKPHKALKALLEDVAPVKKSP